MNVRVIPRSRRRKESLIYLRRINAELRRGTGNNGINSLYNIL
jgi:hypothetical protein